MSSSTRRAWNLPVYKSTGRGGSFPGGYGTRCRLGQFDGASAHMAVEVRDDDGPVLQVKFSFEVDKRTGHARGMIRRNVND